MAIGVVSGCSTAPPFKDCLYIPRPDTVMTVNVGEQMYILKEVYRWEEWVQTRPGSIVMQKKYGSDIVEKRLVYLGMMGDTLRIGYREFRNDMARPAFYEELTFPKTVSTFKTKGVTITILSILQDHRIQYKIDPVTECGLNVTPRSAGGL